MHPTVYRAFERLGNHAAGERVLEVGATPDASSLFNLPYLRGKNRVGLNLFAAEFEGVPISGNLAGAKGTRNQPARRRWL